MNKKITVFTPTYNRSSTLVRVYDSLLKQNYSLFTWLVVDDGSTDDTNEVILNLKRNSPFEIEYFYQANGGKHRAHNTALALADSELMIILDSDDELYPGAIEAINSEWLRVPDGMSETYAGIIGNCVDESGSVVGELFPENVKEGCLFSLVYDGVVIGEKLPCYRLDILKKFPFPELEGSNELVPEGVVWMKIGNHYKVRCINDIVRVYHKNANDSHSLMNLSLIPSSAAWGKMVYSITILNFVKNHGLEYLTLFIKSAINVTRYGMHSRPVVINQFNKLNSSVSKILWLLFLPIGLTYWLYDKYREYR